MSAPLVSVIIPTYQRPELLPRAVESALTYQGPDVEVVVVPNGPDNSWKHSLWRWTSDARVRVSPISTAHGNVARNQGMALATGKYIRFLDDDDYLLEDSRQQLTRLEGESAEVCSGLVQSVDRDGSSLGQLTFPSTRDFVCATVDALYGTGFTQPTGLIFLRSSIANCRWDPMVERTQDYAWMMDISAAAERRWVHVPVPVGAWVQHPAKRVSSNGPIRRKEQPFVKRLLALYDQLTAENRMSFQRTQAIARALWRYAHRGFPYHPFYWSKVAQRARLMDMASIPPDSLYQRIPLRLLNPIIGEWLLLPPRRLTRALRDVRSIISEEPYKRRL
ncbi:MAG: glycosyltransferase [Xanthomonadales bacterium]|nr:glycosyltransferase [Xanthomonadales bacterium]